MKTAGSTNRYFNLFYQYGLYVVLLGLVLTFAILNPRFFSVPNAISILQRTTSTTIAACGLVFVLVIGGLDISLGATMYVSAIVVTLLSNHGLGLAETFGLSLAIGAVVGMLNGFFISRFKINAIIWTLAMMIIVRGLGILIMGGANTISFDNHVSKAIVYTRVFGTIPLIIIILAVTLLCVQLILRNTLFGRQLYAMGNSQQAAQNTGIRVKRNTFLAYTLCGALAGFAGLISGAQVGGIGTSFLKGIEFSIIPATVLGGVSLFGGKGKAFPNAFLGVLIFMVIENGLVMARMDIYLNKVFIGLVIFIAVMLDSMNNRGEKK
jgi:ribose/xylose/arabinose/galactoside ABC-type transport system permease subunit